jgi:hypothetical protein
MAEKRKKEAYSDFSNVETEENFLTHEEFPDGPYGASLHPRETVTNKETPWKEGQRFYSNFNFEDKTFHQNIPRQYPNAHPPHDDPEKDEQVPYGDGS